MEEKKTRKKNTYFDDAWLKAAEFSTWLQKGDFSTTFRCRVCPDKERTWFKTLGDMGIGALRKHAKTACQLYETVPVDTCFLFSKTAATG